MTMLASWIGIDMHGPTSAYIVSDSRLSWNPQTCFEYGKKVFASKLYPEIIGFAGDVIFASNTLSQIVEMIDSGMLFNQNMTCEEKNIEIYEKLCHAFSKYPMKNNENAIKVLHISRETVFKGYPEFHCYMLSWDKTKGWGREECTIPKESGILCIMGSGKQEFIKNYSRYQNGPNKNTSRNVFHCFVDTLFNIQDVFCGGSPQLVGIYRKPNSTGRNYGIIYKKKRYFLGIEVPQEAIYDDVEWRNELFEICDAVTLKPIEGVARQPDVLRRK